MRVHMDWTQVDEFLRNNSSLSEKVTFMKEVMGTVEDFFEHRLKVNTFDKMNLSKLRACHGVKMASRMREDIEQDLVVAIKPFNESTGWFAAAGSCGFDNETGRPVAGVVHLNFMHIRLADFNRYSIPVVFIHELLHVMGFSGWYFQRFGLSKEITVGGKKMMAITSPKVVKHAKEYFGCDSIEGVPIENDGSAG